MSDDTSYLAVDLGAESGRVLLGNLQKKRLTIETLHRFPTKGFYESDVFRWDLPTYWTEIKEGLSRASSQRDLNLHGIGVDSWGVNLVYLTQDNELVCLPFHYRDSLIQTGDEEMRKTLDMKRVYEITGIQEVIYNGLVHLFGVKELYPDVLANSKSIVMIPDYVNYLLTGDLATEYTNATTTQFFDAHSKSFSDEILRPLGLTSSHFPPIQDPGTQLGTLRESVQKETGLGPIPVWSVASHDTASAVVGVPAESENWAFLSSGTWSLLGVEVDSPIINEDSKRFNLTNEGGAFGTIRLLKNVMGLWIIQKCRDIWQAETGSPLSYEELSGEAEAEGVDFTIDVDSPELFNPPNMVEAVNTLCKEQGLEPPENRGQVIHLVYNSLAEKYKQVIDELQAVTKKPIEHLYIVGGGSQDATLNRIIASTLEGIRVYAGPTEATAVGNIMVQAYASGVVSDLREIRKIVCDSFDIQLY